MAKKKDTKQSSVASPIEAEKDQALEATLRDIRSYFNDKGIVMKMGDSPAADIAVTPTGSLLLDAALGVGGYPKGRIVEIYGPESAGKTTFALEAVAQVQKKGGRAAYIDAEHAIDPEYAKTLGVDIDSLILSQPDYGEQALEIVDMLAKSGAIDLIIVDSVAALVPKAELDGTFEDNSVGLQARLMSKALRKLSGILSKSNCTVIFINQLREKVGVMYGNPETTTGGRALKFYATIRIELRRADVIKEGDKIIGNVVKVKVVKNKVAPPYRSCLVDMIYGKGICHDHEIAQLAIDFNLVEKSGSWFSYQGERVGQGLTSLYSWLDSNPEIDAKIEGIIREQFQASMKKQDAGSDVSSDDDLGEEKVDEATGEVQD
ncbi:MAG: recombinase RecA [Bacilli bacterium]|jgi:recombination protein RecA|nr:recombinase RecA [Bacilli bacterium]